MSIRKLAAIGLAIALAAAATFVSLAIGQSPSSPKPAVTQEATTGAARSVPTAPTSVSSARAAFSVLRKSGTGTSSATSDDAIKSRFGLSDGTASTARSSDGTGFRVEAGTGGVCVTASDAGTCASLDDAQAGSLIGTELCGPNIPAGQIRVFGLEPDGVSSVTVTTDKGTRAVVAVVNNVYSAFVEPASVTVQPAGLDHPAVAPLPADFDPTSCSASRDSN